MTLDAPHAGGTDDVCENVVRTPPHLRDAGDEFTSGRGVTEKTTVDASPLRRPGQEIGRVALTIRPPHLERIQSPHRLLLLVA